MTNLLTDFIYTNPIFSQISEIIRAKIAAFFEIIEIPQNKNLFNSDEDTNSIYFLISGEISIDGKKTINKNVPISLKQNSKKKKSIITLSNTKFAKISKFDFFKFATEYPQIALNFTKLKEDPNVYETKSSLKKQGDDFNEISKFKICISWILATLIPLIFYTLMPVSVNYFQNLFICALCSALIFWMFNIFNECVPAFLITIIAVTLQMAPNEIIFKGYFSDAAFFVICLSGLSALVISSEIISKIAIILMNFCKEKLFYIGMFLLSAFMSLVVPSVIRRAKVVANLIKDVTKSYKLENNSLETTKLSIVCFFGAISFSNIFLTGSLVNFIALSFLSDQAIFSLNSVSWFKMTVVPGLIILLANILTFPIILYTPENILKAKKRKEVAAMQLEIIGKSLSEKEIYSLVAISFFYSAFLLNCYHLLPPIVIAMFIFFSIIALGCLTMKEYLKDFNIWFFIFTGSTISILPIMKYIGSDAIIKNFIANTLEGFLLTEIQVITFVVVLAITLRFVFSSTVTLVIMSILGNFIAETYGINQVLIMFVSLIASDVWFFQYQSKFYSVFKSEFSDEIIYDIKTFFLYNAIISIAKIASIYIAIPYWAQLGVK